MQVLSALSSRYVPNLTTSRTLHLYSPSQDMVLPALLSTAAPQPASLQFILHALVPFIGSAPPLLRLCASCYPYAPQIPLPAPLSSRCDLSPPLSAPRMGGAGGLMLSSIPWALSTPVVGSHLPGGGVGHVLEGTLNEELGK